MGLVTAMMAINRSECYSRKAIRIFLLWTQTEIISPFGGSSLGVGRGNLTELIKQFGCLHFTRYTAEYSADRAHSAIRINLNAELKYATLTMAVSCSSQRQRLLMTDGQSASLGVRHPSGDQRPIFLSPWNFFTQCGLFYFVAPSLTRGRVCNLVPLQGFASAVPRDSKPYFIVPILETPQTWRARSPCLYPQGTGWPSYTPGHCVPFCRLLRLTELRWRYSNPPPHGEEGDLITISYIRIQFVPHRNHITSF
jgi:hypothetical protein